MSKFYRAAYNSGVFNVSYCFVWTGGELELQDIAADPIPLYGPLRTSKESAECDLPGCADGGRVQHIVYGVTPPAQSR